MRLAVAAVAVAAALCGSMPAQAEKRVFIIANNADGYGIDRCLASGQKCGAAAAAAYCKSKTFAQATDFHQIDKDEITGAIPTNTPGCKGGACDQFVAIECQR